MIHTIAPVQAIDGALVPLESSFRDGIIYFPLAFFGNVILFTENFDFVRPHCHGVLFCAKRDGYP